ncbi:DUF1622 domain-containing protein [Ruegeria pomeroyi]|nr:DUF1622 domain-containing protein [Ruegeria pomeroyi]MCE8534608.1 DUF1622 domain-containing protein [Ruegeria pomeroyi]
MHFVPHAAELLADILDLLVVALFGIWVLLIVLLIIRDLARGKSPSEITYDVRVGLGSQILLALEILIISDILHSIASRTLEDLGIVAAVVVIRVTLAFFLDRELERLSAHKKSQ